MVLAIHTSDSCNTLVSLDNHHDARSKYEGSLNTTNNCQESCCHSTEEFRKTSLFLPVEDDQLSSSSSSNDGSSLDSNNYGYCNCAQPESLYLPATTNTNSSTSVDDFLQRVAAVREARDELLACAPHCFTEHSPEALLYVHQGEVAHALASQCDVLVSDRATTCHILALRSSTSTTSATTSTSSEPMTSLAHLDSDQYETSIREMIQAHKKHHEGASSTTIEMDIHILGGFADEEGHSQKISNWLLHLLADIASEEASSLLQMRLKTCAISSMNDTGFSCPIGRGLAIHLATGRVFLAKASSQVMGPQVALRNARLWSAGGDQQEEPSSSHLAVVHTTTHNEMTIDPFLFQALPGMDKLIALPDEVLLEYTSTSPCVEEEDFCPSIRATLGFLLQVPCARVFGRHCDRSLSFVRRHAHSNEWKLLAMS